MCRSTSNKNDNKKLEYSDGIRGWLTVMVFVFISFLVFDSYNRHGVIKNPYEIVTCVTTIILSHYFLICLTIIYWFMQIIQSFIIEKLLANDIISEKWGMTLHALNAFYHLTTVLITAITTNANMVVSRILLTYIVYSSTKMWSYAYKNSLYRKSSKEKIKDSEFTQYPANVNIRNLISYFIFTPPIQYKVDYPERTKPDWILFIILSIKLFLVYCSFAFIVYQFIFPELELLKRSDRSYLSVLVCGLRITLPVNVCFYIFNYTNTYRTFLPAYAAWTGMKKLTFCKDWWNSENVTVFWRKWNKPVHYTLKDHVYIPLVKNGFTSLQAQVFCVAIAGIIHEYLNTLPFGIYYATAFMHTMLEIPIGHITTYLGRKYGNYVGNILVWIYLCISHTSGAIYYCFNVQYEIILHNI